MSTLKYKALALDLDGTLTDSNKELPQINKEAIWKAMDQGVIVILASGRPTMGIVGLASELELDKRGGIILAYNGGYVYNCKTGELIDQHVFPKEAITDACEIGAKYGTHPLSYNETHIVCEVTDDEYVLKECKCCSATVKKVDHLASYLDYPVSKLLGTGSHENLLKVQEEFLAKHADTCEAFFSESCFLEMTPKGVSKDKALAKVCNHLGICREELLACGDGMNDIPMLEFAGLGVAMKNAYPKVKECSDVTAPYTNDECGVAWAIEQYML